jgi:hypothetical protein
MNACGKIGFVEPASQKQLKYCMSLGKLIASLKRVIIAFMKLINLLSVPVYLGNRFSFVSLGLAKATQGLRPMSAGPNDDCSVVLPPPLPKKKKKKPPKALVAKIKC